MSQNKIISAYIVTELKNGLLILWKTWYKKKPNIRKYIISGQQQKMSVYSWKTSSINIKKRKIYFNTNVSKS